MNITIFTGNLGRDFEVTTTGSGMTIAKNSLAVRRDFKNKSTGEYETDWIPLTAFGKTAEIMNQYLGKGSKVGITGSLQTSNFTDKDGNKRTGYDVIVNQFEFLDSREDGQQNQQAQQKPVDTNLFQGVTADTNPFDQQSQVNDIKDDDLPF